uniref:Uncharacterized protein n=1 Tax=Knipowitschia caucasica TaxID=637954 RepID=A0AAV2J1D4_KNICA
METIDKSRQKLKPELKKEPRTTAEKCFSEQGKPREATDEAQKDKKEMAELMRLKTAEDLTKKRVRMRVQLNVQMDKDPGNKTIWLRLLLGGHHNPIPDVKGETESGDKTEMAKAEKTIQIIPKPAVGQVSQRKPQFKDVWRRKKKKKKKMKRRFIYFHKSIRRKKKKRKRKKRKRREIRKGR